MSSHISIVQVVRDTVTQGVVFQRSRAECCWVGRGAGEKWPRGPTWQQLTWSLEEGEPPEARNAHDSSILSMETSQILPPTSR